ncbi:MAG: folylpolyglutamate synthase/dihydrofolate synthase family protein [Bacteroidota bacterium]|nr:folylpolyglutamate synthase/dihydrofolate synthase family protein [Bacteroidota bacterium]
MFQQQGISAYRKDLTNVINLLKHLDNPHQKIKTIHIAGTNGKGSTSSMLASILQEAGYKVGLYTSPHLKDFRERIKINRQPIPEEEVCHFVKQNKVFFEENNLSFFEMTVGMAFEYFYKQNTDINIIETGLGGKLDSTNVISPIISIITNIGLDHTNILGNTLKDIAVQKAGIIKSNIPVIIGEYTTETKQVFVEVARSIDAPIYFASDNIKTTPDSDLKGIYQEQNKKTVLQAVTVLREVSQLKISDNHVKNGLLNVVKNTGLQGRWQILQNNPTIVCDTAHNVHGLSVVMQQLAEQQYEQLHLVIGVVADKDLDEILPLFPKKATYYFCKPNLIRGLDAVVLEQKARTHNLYGKVYNSVQEAFDTAKQNATSADLIYVGGSTFVVAEVL